MDNETNRTERECNSIERVHHLGQQLCSVLSEISDPTILKVVQRGVFNDLLRAILEPAPLHAQNYPSIAEFFLANKWRATLLALMRHVITHNYSISKTKDGDTRYVSPSHHQWFNDGVMTLEGSEPFSGFITVYRNGELKVALAARDVRAGEQMGPEAFEFVTKEEFDKRRLVLPKELSEMERTVRRLEHLLDIRERRESMYQSLLRKSPWILGAQFREIQDHRRFDDVNIPDFTGVRVADNKRDIIEIKQPFLRLFLRNGDFSQEFNQAWNQAERYLNFAREEKDYLRRKGLLFDNPKCFLLVGYQLPNECLTKIHAKERLNPAIHLLTYNDVVRMAHGTIEFFKNLSAGGARSSARRRTTRR